MKQKEKKAYKINNKNHYSQSFPMGWFVLFSWIWWCNSFWIDFFSFFSLCFILSRSLARVTKKTDSFDCTFFVVALNMCVCRAFLVIFSYSLHFFLQIRVYRYYIFFFVAQNIFKVQHIKISSRWYWTVKKESILHMLAQELRWGYFPLHILNVHSAHTYIAYCSIDILHCTFHCNRFDIHADC